MKYTHKKPEKKLRIIALLGLLAGLFSLTLSSAGAAVTFDPATGTGFVGKGDVQTALGLNNAQLQAQANGLQFTFSSTSVTDTTWTCDRDAGDQTQERARTTTTTTQGIVSKVARERNQITGFFLTGLSGTPTQTSETEGPPAGSCPTNWTAINQVTSDPVITSSGLFVNGVLLQ